MGYGSKGLNDWRDEALRIAKNHGFTAASLGEDVALIHSELSEMLEDVRDGRKPTEVWYEEKVPAFDAEGKPITMDTVGGANRQATVAVRHGRPFPKKDDGWDVDRPRKPCGISSELADVIIRVLHFAGKHEIDIEQAVREKMFYNETRAHKHGGKTI